MGGLLLLFFGWQSWRSAGNWRGKCQTLLPTAESFRCEVYAIKFKYIIYFVMINVFFICLIDCLLCILLFYNLNVMFT